LKIDFTDALIQGTTVDVMIEYSTGDKATGLNWLDKDQTENKTMPYLFSQCEPIYCRSIAPLQDTPSIKATYTADVTIPKTQEVFMSANKADKSVAVGKDQMKYSFTMEVPIASYLLAIAVGDIGKNSVGSRTFVLAEKGKQLETATKIYGDSDFGLENALDRAEKYLTPYIWGTYSLLILPPSFPYGGMENPRMTFASPTTIMTDDTSQTYVATHEIAHSWTGNEVTCQNWSNMWLNEGFTVFEERHVSAEQHGMDFAKIEMLLGTYDVADSFANFPADSSYSSLDPHFNGANPDGSFSEVPYEKGFWFLWYLQALMNDGLKDGEDMFQPFLQGWILKKKEMSANADQLKLWYDEYLNTAGFVGDKLKKLQGVDWVEWTTKPGYPKDYLDNYHRDQIFWFDTPESHVAFKLADEYVALAGEKSPFNLQGFNKWTPNQQVLFVNRLAYRQSLNEMNIDILYKIDADLNISNTIQPEVKQRWYPLGIMNDYVPVFKPAKEFVQSVGRMKYLNPIYEAMCQNGYRDMAFQWYKEKESFYHPIARATLKKYMQIGMTLEDEEALEQHEAVKAFLKE